jgi:hypothetical protein|uniref:Uncharacterized protein n=1 Tax=Siphoviridae sp. ctGuJ10 TaxID=2825418 RepID=A0A8S5PUE8_9CAUD|nr:MAG TPA: hypothetical protein [Siphoviridae sp. ctGuJ10]
MIPYYPTEDSRESYDVETIEYKLVSEYCGCNFNDVFNMGYFYFLYMLKEAFIYRMSQTDSGQEYLENAYRLQMTSPNKEKLRKKFKK